MRGLLGLKELYKVGRGVVVGSETCARDLKELYKVGKVWRGVVVGSERLVGFERAVQGGEKIGRGD